MSEKKEQQKRSNKTKKKILETALQLFSQKGYNAVTVDEIAKVSGTSKGAFYGHFNSKYEIFLEKFKDIDDFYADFVQTLQPELTSSAKIKLFINQQMDYIQNQLGQDLMRVIYINAVTPNSNNYFLNQNRNVFHIIRTFIKEGQEKKEFDNKQSIDDLTFMFTQILLGCIYRWCISDTYYSLQEESGKLIIVFLKGLEVKE